MRPDPAPITWMIDAHSAFESMSATDAFCTLRILPRIGSSAWNSLSRASLAVPSAESPSTMNSSVPSTSFERQSTSFAGSDDDSRAFLRRCVSLCARAEMRLFISATIFSSTSAVCALSSRFELAKRSAIAFAIVFATMLRIAGVPRISFVCPSNCGSAMRTVSTAVRPARMSSFSSLSPPFVDGGDLEPAGVLLDLGAQELDQPLLEPGLVRAALRRRDDVHEAAEDRVVPGPPAQRDVDLALARQLGRDHVAVLLQHRHGLGVAAGAVDAPGAR